MAPVCDAVAWLPAAVAELKHHERFLALQRLARDRLQLGAVPDAFDCHQDDRRRIRPQHEAREVERIEVRLVAAAGFVTDAEARHLRAPHDGDLAESAAVAHHADIAGLPAGAADGAGGRHREAVDKIDHAVAVGPHDAHAGCARKRHQRA